MQLKSYRNDIKETLQLAYPVAIGQLSHVMLGVEDSIMVGKVGSVPLAAASIVNGLVFLVMVIGLGMTLAITPLVSIARGEKNENKCGLILRQAVLINSVFALVLFGITYGFSDIIYYLNQTREVSGLAASYTRILSFSIIPFMLFQSYRQFVEGLGHTRPAMYITIGANFFNIFFNWVFIYGNWGAPAMGLDGAGYSTLLTRIMMALSMAGYVIFSGKYMKFKPLIFPRKVDVSIIKRLIFLGLPSGFQHFFEVGAFAFSAVMIGWLGSNQLAAHQIALNMASVTFMIILGIAAAASIRVGHAVGRKEPHAVRRAGFTAVVMAGSIMAFFALILILFRHQLPLIYISDPEVVGIASSLLVVAGFFQISDGVQAVGLGNLRGITDAKIPMYISFIAYWMVGIPIGYGLGFKLGLDIVGVWIGLMLGLTAAAILLTLRFHIKTKI